MLWGRIALFFHDYTVYIPQYTCLVEFIHQAHQVSKVNYKCPLQIGFLFLQYMSSQVPVTSL